jgi:acylphosphatase
MQTSQVHAVITGQVQGVSFRYFTYHEALKLGLKGWVRNLRDGRVEALFEGEQESIERVLGWCKLGPPAARVEEVQVEWQPPSGKLDAFRVRPTANLGEPA